MATWMYLAVWVLQTANGTEESVFEPIVETESSGSGLLLVLGEISPFAWAILIILLGFSVASWGVILSKARLFGKIRKESETFWRMFRKARTLSEVSTACETLRFTPLVRVFDAGYDLVGPPGGAAGGGVLTRVKGTTGLERVLQRSAAAQITTLESRMTFLATTASVTPFIGLLGTVVGVIGSFAGLANAEVTTLRAVAPGISDALIATALGLFAAIPAVVAYNHFVAQIRRIGGQLDDLSAELLAVAESNE